MIPKVISSLAKINYDPLMIRIKLDIHRWNTNPFLSLVQRGESVKMNILRRLLFLFQALPVRFKTLQLSKEKGGMAVPHLRDYYLSAQIKPFLNLCNRNYRARWKDIEVQLIRNPTAQTVLSNTDLRKLISNIQNPWMKFQFKICNSMKEDYNLQDKLKVLE